MRSFCLFAENLLHNISEDDITESDITLTDIPMADIWSKETKMGKEAALTEAVYYILLSLCKPQHGYGIMQNAEALSGGRIHLAFGTLYGALSSLLEKGWITAAGRDNGDRKKEYIITEKGREVLENELERLKQLVRNGEEILGGSNNE
jgi:Predicted transcriptional regulators